MKKTIGGDRLGSGKNMQVELHGYERSSHNIGYVWRSTMASGTLVPFLTEIATPGTTMDIELETDIMTHPTIGPLFGSYKVQLDVFACPIRLYQGKLHNNAQGIGMNMSSVKLPLIEMEAGYDPNSNDMDNSQINPSSIFSYLGIRGLGRTRENIEGTVRRQFNAIPYLAYWDIYKNYYANKQEEIGALIHHKTEQNKTIQSVTVTLIKTPGTPVTLKENGMSPTVDIGRNQNGGDIVITWGAGQPAPRLEDVQMIMLPDGYTLPLLDLWTNVIWNAGNRSVRLTVWKHPVELKLYGWKYSSSTEPQINAPKVETFPLKNIDDMREDILVHTKQTNAFIINKQTQAPYGLALQGGNESPYSKLSSLEGLAVKTYQSDLFNNWMSTEWIDGENGINSITAVDVSSGELTIDALSLARKVYNMLNRIAISGGSYSDWMDATYTHDRVRMADSPIYQGGLIKELVFEEVISNSEVEGSPLGTLAGRGKMGHKHKGGTIRVRVDEPSYIMGIVSLTPRIDYSQGNRWDVALRTMDDLHKPALDGIGFQDLITDQMAFWDSRNTGGFNYEFRSAGKQPAWLNYMTNVNQVKGNFAMKDNQMFMTLNRRYEQSNSNNIKDLTSYIDPEKFNFIFAETARDSQNFWVQIGIKNTARRKMSAKIMPNL